MRATLADELPLICPACRRRTEAGREMHTVALVVGVPDAQTGEIEEGVLACVNPACGKRYPIVAGIPILARDLAGLLGSQMVAIVESDLPQPVAAVLAEAGPDGATYPRLMETMSIYLDAQWGDRVEPACDGPAPQFGFAAIAGRITARSEAPVGRALELGCSVGRGLAELARGADLAVGLDNNFGALRRARRLLAGKQLTYGRRTAGRHYRVATIRPGDRAASNVALVCGDALDPPLTPGSFARVAAFNLLDAVSHPRGLLSTLDGLCEPGGELMMTSPYSWESHVSHEDERLPGSDPAAALRKLLESGDGLEAPYALQDEATLRWWLRRDTRSAVVYDTHYLRAQKRF
ncbi:MAG: methyltransferase domain-containing protein [Deltaproteobacteria bacterium]|nr:methyltransferase domain-containing protein [Deltaproteobacteria bacterium]